VRVWRDGCRKDVAEGFGSISKPRGLIMNRPMSKMSGFTAMTTALALPSAPSKSVSITKIDTFEAVNAVAILAIRGENGIGDRRFAVCSRPQHAGIRSGSAMPKEATPIKTLIHSCETF
jgi:hypothetical protein